MSPDISSRADSSTPTPRSTNAARVPPEARAPVSEVENSLDVAVLVSDDHDRAALTEMVVGAGYVAASAGSVGEAGRILNNTARPKVLLCDEAMALACDSRLSDTARYDPNLDTPHIILINVDPTRIASRERLYHDADDSLGPAPKVSEVVARLHVGMRMWSMREQLRRAALTDGLTGLFNHDRLVSALEVEWSRARRYGQSLSLLMIDVDHFKAINDTCGHMAGNEALSRTAAVLQQCVRSMDTAGRFGGDEFAVVLPQATLNDAKVVAQRIRASVAESVRINAHPHQTVTVSIGVAASDNPQAVSAASLLELADQALYAAKRGGRNRVAESATPSDACVVVAEEEVERLRHTLAVLSAQAKEAFMQSVASLLQALDEKDPYTARHAVNVAFYAERIAEHLGFPEAQINTIRHAAMLHDVGKVGVPDHILLKPAALSPSERMVMEQVPMISARVVGHLRMLDAEAPIIRHHQERHDGRGFPAGLVGVQIPLGARIVHVADAFDAMTTDRVYRRRRGIDQAIVELEDNAGTQFDPEIVRAAVECVARQRPLWQQRIDETIKAMGDPDDVHLSMLNV